MAKNPMKVIVFGTTIAMLKGILSQKNIDLEDKSTKEGLAIAKELMELTSDDAKAHNTIKALFDAHEKGEDVSKVKLPDFFG